VIVHAARAWPVKAAPTDVVVILDAVAHVAPAEFMERGGESVDLAGA
jgi:hypothetical protein